MVKMIAVALVLAASSAPAFAIQFPAFWPPRTDSAPPPPPPPPDQPPPEQ